MERLIFKYISLKTILRLNLALNQKYEIKVAVRFFGYGFLAGKKGI